ncbi:MAG: hypothetical protein CVV21_11450 [Candidatus Goldiibacteriota bacterium HGW-Goldbacteria-1]|nr:MAG: hypothetical protein CVV21_11450 [Candidatus Goldiibacteriota bacterium HGW-Goldbacteria-1]
MKIILSRKGFDSSFGMGPSPILPDGTLLFFPIPQDRALNKFSDIKLPKDVIKLLKNRHENYYTLIKELIPKYNGGKNCHLDPDIYGEALQRKAGWRGVFGQSTAQTHLENQGVWQGDGKTPDEGDIFLFFGYFRKTEADKYGKLRYTGDGLHVIYGYMEVGMVIDVKTQRDKIPAFAAEHPHVKEPDGNRSKNVIYIAREKLSWDKNLKGWGYFKYDEKLHLLTKPSLSRSKWQLPHCFNRNTPISCHTKDSWKKGYFQSARGQEFVIEPNNEIKTWAKKLIKESVNG